MRMDDRMRQEIKILARTNAITGIIKSVALVGIFATLLALAPAKAAPTSYIPHELDMVESLAYCSLFFNEVSKTEPEGGNIHIFASELTILYIDVASDVMTKEETITQIKKVTGIAKKEIDRMNSYTSTLPDKEAHDYQFDFGYGTAQECITIHLPELTEEIRKNNGVAI